MRAAHTNSGIERKAFNSKRVSVLKRAGSALCVWLADKAKKDSQDPSNQGAQGRHGNRF